MTKIFHGNVNHAAEDGGGAGATPPMPRMPPAAPPPAPAPAADLEAAQRAMAEAAHYRIRSKDAEEKLEQKNQQILALEASLPDRVREATQPIEQRFSALQQRVVKAELRAAALAEGLRDLDLLPLVDRSKIAVDEHGEVTGAAEAIQAFKQSKPEYFQPAAPPPAVGVNLRGVAVYTPPPPPPPGNLPPPADLRTLPKADVEKLRAEALRKLRGAR